MRISRAAEPKLYGSIRTETGEAEESPDEKGVSVYTLRASCIERWFVIRDYTGGIVNETRSLEYDGADTLTLDLNGTLFTFKKDSEREKTDPMNNIMQDLAGVWFNSYVSGSDDDHHVSRYTFREDGTMRLEYLKCDEEGNIADGELESPYRSGEGTFTVTVNELILKVEELTASSIDVMYDYEDGQLVLYGSITSGVVYEKQS